MENYKKIFATLTLTLSLNLPLYAMTSPDEAREGAVSHTRYYLSDDMLSSTSPQHLITSSNFQDYLSLAKKDDKIAQYQVGTCFESGQGTSRNLQKAVKWYRLSAENGDLLGQCALARCYEEGIGIARDLPEALKWYTAAVEQGDIAANYNLGTCKFKIACTHSNENGEVGELVLESFSYILKAAKAGVVEAEYRVGEMIIEGHHIKIMRQRSKVPGWFLRAAEKGHVKAQCELAKCFHTGFDGMQNPRKVNFEKAVEWYEKSEKGGSADAKLNLAVLRFKGQGTERNIPKAIGSFKELAEQGNPYAQYNLSLCYKKGEGVEKNKEKASELYLAAKKQGLHLPSKWGFNKKPSFMFKRLRCYNRLLTPIND
ncbi:MAG: SEL1-like repeat protein [Candidatus Paracaedibacteraceae bacterium]|nr:SEL1-like repeat protein [Candidatus Paracaedibacteraceae bacterium]